MSSSSFPANALSWLVNVGAKRILALGKNTTSLLPQLLHRGHQITINDPDPDRVHTIMRRYPALLPTVAQPDRLPFIPCSFDAVLMHGDVSDLNSVTVLSEIARVLTPNGYVSLANTYRDDSVPWVRRLAAIVQRADPTAMATQDDADVSAWLTSVSFFPRVERFDARRWVPVTNEQLVAMVQRRLAGMDTALVADVLDEVCELYASLASPLEPLRLPYRVLCWRAEVDHTEFTSQLRPPDDGLSIML